jgi:hypothetical protein
MRYVARIGLAFNHSPPGGRPHVVNTTRGHVDIDPWGCLRTTEAGCRHDAVCWSCVAKDTGGPYGPCQDGRVACGCRLQAEGLATRACPHVAMKTFGYVVVYAYSHVLTRFAEAP